MAGCDEKKIQELTFEEAMTQLEELAAAMESGKLPLDKLIDSYEKGSKLVKFCRSKLSKLENRIEILSRDDGNTGEWKDFDPSSSEGENSGRWSALVGGKVKKRMIMEILGDLNFEEKLMDLPLTNLQKEEILKIYNPK